MFLLLFAGHECKKQRFNLKRCFADHISSSADQTAATAVAFLVHSSSSSISVAVEISEVAVTAVGVVAVGV